MTWIAGAGIGVKAYLANHLFAGPEIRYEYGKYDSIESTEWGPFIQGTIGIGHAIGRPMH